MARDKKPHLVLLDLRLPDANGLDICTQLDELPSTCGTPIIILSGVESSDVIRRTRTAGGLFFVRKPYDPSALLVLIQHAIDVSHDTTWCE